MGGIAHQTGSLVPSGFTELRRVSQEIDFPRMTLGASFPLAKRGPVLPHQTGRPDHLDGIVPTVWLFPLAINVNQGIGICQSFLLKPPSSGFSHS